MANIGVLPFEADEDDCAYCFYFHASMNEDFHMVEFFDHNGDLVHSTGFQNKEAKKYCIIKTSNNSGYLDGFQAWQQYTARLTLNNYCGDEAVEEYSFQLPDIGCDNQDEPEYPVKIKTIISNPFVNSVFIDYEVMEAGSLEIQLINIVDPGKYVQMLAPQNVNKGLYQKSSNTTMLPSGVYALIVNFNEQFVSLTMVKN